MRDTRTIICAVALGLVIQLSPAVALAQQYYLSLQVGYNMVDDGDLEFGPEIPTSYESRPAFGGAFGYIGPGGFRIESELSRRDNDIDTVAGVNDAGRLTSLNLMINALYELQFGGGGAYGLGPTSPLRPYLGIGGGGGRYTLEAIPNLAAAPVIDDQAYAFAYQGIVGLGVEIAEHAVLTFDYRYLVTENIKMRDVTMTPFEIDSVQSTFMLGLRATF